MFVKDLARLCLVDPLVATIFFFRGCTQPCGFGYRRRICMARHLRRWPFPVSNVCGLLPQHSADATPEPIRMLSTPPKGCRRVHRPVFLCLPLLFTWWPRYLRSESGRIFIRSSGRLIWTADSPLNLTHMQLSCFGALAFFLTWTSRQPMRICSIERISDTWRWDSHVTSPFFLNNWIRLIRRRNGTNGNDWNTQSADCVWRHLPLISGLMKRFTSNDVSVSLQSSQQTSSSWIVVRLDAIVFSSVKFQLVRLIWCKKLFSQGHVIRWKLRTACHYHQVRYLLR